MPPTPRSLSSLALFGLLAVTTLALLLPGCLKYRQTLTVQPDGSGKMDLVVGMSNATRTQRGPDNDPLAGFSVAALAENPQGFVAFTEPRADDRDGFRVITVTGYFEDVNQLGFTGGEGGFDAVSYELTDGKLTVLRPLAGQAAAAFATESLNLADEEVRRVMAPAVAGLELAERYVLPGRVTAAGPLRIEGDEASVSVEGAASLERYPQLMTDYAGLDRLEILFDARALSPEAEAAWAQELADAKATWARLVRGGG